MDEETKTTNEIMKKIQEAEERKDSIEMGSPGKGGAVKVYFNSADLEDAKKRIDNSLEARKYMAEKMTGTV